MQLRYHLAPVDWARYDGTTSGHHRQYILRQFGVAPFAAVQAAVLQQVTHSARHQIHPVAVFRSAAEFIRSYRWEVPAYAALAGVVTEALRAVEQHFTSYLAQHLPPELLGQLDTLFTPGGAGPAALAVLTHHAQTPYGTHAADGDFLRTDKLDLHRLGKPS